MVEEEEEKKELSAASGAKDTIDSSLPSDPVACWILMVHTHILSNPFPQCRVVDVMLAIQRGI